MAQSLTDPVELFRARGSPEAHAIRLALEQVGIPVRIDGELLQGAVGELPMGWNTAPRIMVNQEDGARALVILKGFLDRIQDGEEEGDDVAELETRCLACNGIIPEDDEACPNCGWSYEAHDEGDEPPEEAR